jgi:hypothetical protein
MTQPLALRLAEKLDAETQSTVARDLLMFESATELRRLHAENADLLEVLEYIVNNLVPFEFLDDSRVRHARAIIAEGETK